MANITFFKPNGALNAKTLDLYNTLTKGPENARICSIIQYQCLLIGFAQMKNDTSTVKEIVERLNTGLKLLLKYDLYEHLDELKPQDNIPPPAAPMITVS